MRRITAHRKGILPHEPLRPVLWSGVFGFMACVREVIYGLEVFLRQRHGAADQPLAAVLDFDEWPMAEMAILTHCHKGRRRLFLCGP